MPKKSKKTTAEPTLYVRLQDHFGKIPAELPVLEQSFAGYEPANFQLALNEILSELECATDSIGIVSRDWDGPSLAKISRPKMAKDFSDGPVEYVDVSLAEGQQLACIKQGLILLKVENEAVALLIHQHRHSYDRSFIAEVMGSSREVAERFLRRLTHETRLGRAFKGKILSLETDCRGQMTVHFHRLQRIGREEIILPEELLQRIERHTISFSRHAERLRAAKRHLKRGILLHGSPGTGKTLSAMYLAAQMTGRSVILITGQGMGSIETACKLARMLEPATVILEDADLIGTERGQQMLGANSLLFELLNQMDGLAEDADVLFILTTNRPDKLEPALAARPGRIDQAIEVPPPDSDCRHRLIELYGRGLRLELKDREALIKRTEGVSAAFLRELLRKAAIYAAESQPDSDAELAVTDDHIAEGLNELLIAGGTLTQSLLAARTSTIKPD